MNDFHSWIYHSLGLTRSALSSAHKLLQRERDEKDSVSPERVWRVEWLTMELAFSDYCVVHRKYEDRYQGAVAVWWDWVSGHAELQIKRYGKELAEQDFHAICHSMRQERDRCLYESDGYLKKVLIERKQDDRHIKKLLNNAHQIGVSPDYPTLVFLRELMTLPEDERKLLMRDEEG